MFAGYLEYLELLVFTRVACVAACLLTTHACLQQHGRMTGQYFVALAPLVV